MYVCTYYACVYVIEVLNFLDDEERLSTLTLLIKMHDTLYDISHKYIFRMQEKFY